MANSGSELSALVADDEHRRILVEAGLFAADPTAIPGLVDRMSVDCGIDPNYQPIPYNTKLTTGEKVQCSVCSARVWHFSGFIVQNGDSQLGLVGWECGETKLFGEGGWQSMVNRTDRAQKEALFETRWRPARAKVTELSAVLVDWMRQVGRVDEEQSSFAETFPQLATWLRKNVPADEIIQVVKIADRFGKTSYERKVIRRTRIGWFLRGRVLSKRIDVARKALEAVAGMLTPNCTVADIGTIRQKLKDARDIVAECEAMQAGLPELNDQELWKAIVKAVRYERVAPGTFKAHKRRLVGQDYDYEYAFPYPALPIKTLDRYPIGILGNWPSI